MGRFNRLSSDLDITCNYCSGWNCLNTQRINSCHLGTYSLNNQIPSLQNVNGFHLVYGFYNPSVNLAMAMRRGG